MTASVEYQLFVLKLDVGSTASLGKLVGMGKKLNETHVQVGYGYVRASGGCRSGATLALLVPGI